MNSQLLFDKEVDCPVCGGWFKTKVVKSSVLRIKRKDSDFCNIYHDLIPYVYDVWVCPHCGYAAFFTKFKEITDKEAKLVRKGLLGKWVEQDYGQERTVEEGIKTYLFAALTMTLREITKSSLKSTLWLKLAWLYRNIENKVEENKYLQKALDCYKDIYENERLPIGSMTDAHVAYLIGDLSRRLGNNNDAILWFAKAINSPEIKFNAQIEKLTRDQWLELKTKLREEKNLTKEEIETLDGGKIDDIAALLETKK